MYKRCLPTVVADEPASAGPAWRATVGFPLISVSSFVFVGDPTGSAHGSIRQALTKVCHKAMPSRMMRGLKKPLQIPRCRGWNTAKGGIST